MKEDDYLNKYQSKIAKEAKRIKREIKLSWSVCKFGAKKRLRIKGCK
jgi:hypothetical protein